MISHQQAEFSADGSSITWVNGTDLSQRNTTRQLMVGVTWYRCELRPDKCTDGGVRYADTSSVTIARHNAPGMNLANTPHFEGSQFQWQLVTNRRYMIEVIGIPPLGVLHLEAFQLEVGGMRLCMWHVTRACGRSSQLEVGARPAPSTSHRPGRAGGPGAPRQRVYRVRDEPLRCLPQDAPPTRHPPT